MQTPRALRNPWRSHPRWCERILYGACRWSSDVSAPGVSARAGRVALVVFNLIVRISIIRVMYTCVPNSTMKHEGTLCSVCALDIVDNIAEPAGKAQ